MQASTHDQANAISEFNKDHYKHWGKMYTSEDVSVSWHVPNEQEIDFVLQIFRELVEPTLAILEGLLQPGTPVSSTITSMSD